MALITDGRFSGATHGLMVGHVAPEAALGGPIALVRDGDTIVIDVRTPRAGSRRPRGRAGDATRRLAPPAPRYATGVIAKYAAMVSSASLGAVDHRRPPGAPARDRHDGGIAAHGLGACPRKRTVRTAGGLYAR